LIIMDGRIRRMQINKKKPCFLQCRFGASSLQAIGVTRKILLPFRLYLLLDVWCILGDKHYGHIECMYSESVRISNRCVTSMRILFP